jgi:hypothetical protein
MLKDTMKFVFMMDLYTQASRYGITPLAVIDLAKQEFNIRFPVTHTTHVYPGVVATALFKHLPWYIRGPSNVILPLVARSSVQYADVAVWEIASDEVRSLRRAFWDQYGREVTVDKHVQADSELRQLVWENLLQLGGMN